MTSTSVQRLGVKIFGTAPADTSEAIYSIITILMEGARVITHRLLSNSPLRPHRRTHIRGVSIIDNGILRNTRTSSLHQHAARQYDREWMTLCILRSGHLVLKTTESGTTSAQVSLTDSQHSAPLGACNSPSRFSHARLFGEKQTGNNRTMRPVTGLLE